MQPIRSTAALFAALFTLLALGACGTDDQPSTAKAWPPEASTADSASGSA